MIKVNLCKSVFVHSQGLFYAIAGVAE